MPDGRYKRVQCYSSICWCVNEETGKNIQGTFSKKKPQCDEVSAVRPMKGCTGSRKTQFLKELKEFLIVAMVEELVIVPATRQIAWHSTII